MFKGLSSLSNSSKAIFGLIILSCATTGLLMDKLDGPSYAAVVGTIGTIFMWTRYRSDRDALGIKGDS